MKAFSFILLVVTGVLFFFSACHKYETGTPDVPIFSFINPIVNPPDSFLIQFNISSSGEKIAYINFDTTGVWQIDKLGDGRVTTSLINVKSEVHFLDFRDTVGLSQNEEYRIVVNNNSSQIELNNFFLYFIKLDVDYASYEPKFK
ncbi:MAG: hypothetical protein Q8S18_12535 [Bacteroidales bacterium]|nr:hypothetical protein [Bacteroidales bacterium]